MKGNRKAAEAIIIAGVEEILPGGGNKELYEQAFKAMSDKQFEAFMQALSDGRVRLPIVAPNFGKVSLEVERNIEIGKRWGVKFFERIWINPGNGLPRYLSGPSYMILELNMRRQAQILIDKISIPRTTETVDDLTGQPAGESKGGKLTYPEAMILKGQELNWSLIELERFRGGDTEGFRVMNTLIDETGQVDLEDIVDMDSEVESRRTQRVIFTCMMIDNNL